MDDRLLTERETADLTRLSPRTLERLRATGTGCQYVKLGRRVFYRPLDLQAWIDSNLCSSTSAVREIPNAQPGRGDAVRA